MDNEIVAAPNETITKVKELHRDIAFADECENRMKELRTTSDNYNKTLESLDDAIQEASYSIQELENTKRKCKKSLSDLLVQLSQ